MTQKSLSTAGVPSYISVLIVVCLLSYGEALFLKSMFWTTTNTQFISRCKSGCTFGGYHINLLQMTKVTVICPNPGIILKEITSNVPNDLLHENFIMVEEEDFEACRYNSSKSSEGTRIIKNCTHNPHGPLQYITLAFQQFNGGDDFIRAFIPGETYYFISTSDGTKDSLVNNKGPGHCNDVNNNLAMKLSVYVCKNTADCNSKPAREYQLCHCPPSSTVLLPSPTPSVTRQSSQTSQFIQAVKSTFSAGSGVITPSPSQHAACPSSTSMCPPTTNQSCDCTGGTPGSRTGERTSTTGPEPCIVWLIIVILALIVSLIGNMVLYIKNKDKKCSASVDDRKNGVITNYTNTGYSDTNSQDNKKDPMVDYADGHKNNYYSTQSLDSNGYPMKQKLDSSSEDSQDVQSNNSDKANSQFV